MASSFRRIHRSGPSRVPCVVCSRKMCSHIHCFLCNVAMYIIASPPFNCVPFACHTVSIFSLFSLSAFVVCAQQLMRCMTTYVSEHDKNTTHVIAFWFIQCVAPLFTRATCNEFCCILAHWCHCNCCVLTLNVYISYLHICVPYLNVCVPNLNVSFPFWMSIFRIWNSVSCLNVCVSYWMSVILNVCFSNPKF